MEELIFYIVILVLLTISGKLFPKFKQNRNAQKIETYLQTLKYVDIDTDTIVVDGTSYTQSVPVDVYDTELDPNSPNFYRGTGGTSDFKFRNTFHKQKDFTRFKSTVYVPIIYQDQEYKFSMNFPIDQTTLRMKLYMQKKLRAYIQEFNDMDDTRSDFQFLLDFRFLNDKSITLVPTNDYKI
ncbi:hypothetical protein SAMN05421766_10714 [Zobellia uliginosa]|uniref:Uncharacterized protein n=1 Tax=Zobellia uliginosa TaxID=143224 RepID=A0ABY1L4S8_9FLAO|nr:hypothetical protein [Zobellia uliginosa]SIT01336.1 hypothetical protein SAMN05421766_10714 [Zobellia uliginosa]